MHRVHSLFIVLCLLLPAATLPGSGKKVFREGEYRAHLNFLASDLLEGRATGSRGARIASAYIAACFQSLGLRPGGDDNSYFQWIDFDGFDAREKDMSVEFITRDGIRPLKPVEEICMLSEVPGAESIAIDAPLWFAGYGITAPEYDWDDFKDFDARGKLLVTLVNDPEPESGFGNESLTYYGRWTYKIEMARRRGARGIIMIHADREATYGWNVVQTSWTGERIDFHEPRAHRLQVIGWIRHDALERALGAGGPDYASLKSMAERRDFRPRRLGARFRARFTQTVRHLRCANVIGILPGNDPRLRNEAVMYTAHYDHLGVGLADDRGDTIYNGALDNASGTAALLCLARAFVRSPRPPRRTLVFMPVTGEEMGLMGSTWYARHPVIHLKRTVVVINKDCMNHFGRRRAFSAFPVEYTTALKAVRRIGAKAGLKLVTHTVDRGGGAFRSDHFPFAARGVPALSVGMTGEPMDLTSAQVRKIRDRIGPTYHRPCDEVNPLWRYDGVIQELDLLYRLGRYWADGAPRPRLRMDDEGPYAATRRWYGLKTEAPAR